MTSMRNVALGLIAVVLLGADDSSPPRRGGGPDIPRAKKSRKSARRRADEPPPCRSSRDEAAPRRPPAQSMPELFTRMGEAFTRNPAGGFQEMLGELSAMEGPAFRDVRLTAAEERQVGRKAREEYLRRAADLGHRVVNDRDELDYLRALVENLARRMNHRDRYPNIDITLIRAQEADGQSFPGGFLVFTTGLLDEPDEATVAGVVAHELAHLDCSHLYEYAKRSKLAEATYARPPGMEDSFDQFFTRQMALFGLLMNPYRPEHEHEADCTSVTWLYQEGYDPRALVDFFERLHRHLNDRPDPPFFSFGRTHPFSLDRREACRDRLAQLRRWRPNRELGRYADNLKTRTPKERERIGN